MTDAQVTPSVNSQYLYRLRDANGALLYVGVTVDWPSRMKQHQADKPWWSDVLAVELVRMDCSRRQLEAIEKAVIKTEAPIHNVVHNGLVRNPASVVKLPAQPRSEDRFKLPDYGAEIWTENGTTYHVGEVVRHTITGKHGYILGGDNWGADLQFKDEVGHLGWSSLVPVSL